jgi:hypothetical protein
MRENGTADMHITMKSPSLLRDKAHLFKAYCARFKNISGAYAAVLI